MTSYRYLFRFILLFLLSRGSQITFAQTEVFTQPVLFKQCEAGVQPLPFLYETPADDLFYTCNNTVYDPSGAVVIPEVRDHFKLHFTGSFAFETRLFRLPDDKLRIETYSYPFFGTPLLLNRADYITPGIVPYAHFRVGERYIYTGQNNEGKQVLYTTDGTLAGTTVLLDAIITSSVVSLKNSAVFSIKQNDINYNVYTKGSSISTIKLKQDDCSLRTGIEISYNQDLYFLCQRLTPEDTFGYRLELWNTNGTAGGTKKLSFLDEKTERIEEIIGEVSGSLLFIYSSPGDTLEKRVYHLAALNIKNGTKQIIFSSADSFTANNESIKSETRKLMYMVFRWNNSGQLRSEIWASNGTPEGSKLLHDSSKAEYGFSLALTGTFEKYLFFRGADSTHGSELWITDGTTEGTKLFSDIIPGPESSDPNYIRKTGNRLFFREDTQKAIYSFEACLSCIPDGTGNNDDVDDIGTLAAPAKLKFKRKKGKYTFTMQKGETGASYELILKRQIITKKGKVKFRVKKLKSSLNIISIKKLTAGKWTGIYRISYGQKINQITKFSVPKNFKVKPLIPTSR